MDDNSYKLFDDELRGKLENFNVSGAPEGWDALESKIAADADLSGDPFDEMIKSKLEGGKAAYDPGLWSLMESKIEADADLTISELEDIQFDGMMYENLNFYNVPYNPSHWELMLKRINEEFSIQHKLYRYKVAEVSLMILAILTLLQFYPGQTNSNHTPENNQVIASTSVIEVDEANDNALSESLSSEVLIASAEKEIPKVVDTNIANSSITNDVNINPVNVLTNAKTSAEIVEEILPLPLKETHGVTSVAEDDQKGEKEITTDLLANEVSINEENLAFDESILGLLTLESADMESFENNKNKPLPFCESCKLEKPWLIKLGMLTSLDANLVMTPFDEYFSSESYDQLTSGYTGGLSFSMHKNRIGFSTGVSYSSKAYGSKKNTELRGSLAEGYVEEGFEGAQLNILSIPVNFTYGFDNKGKWQWYSVIGASAKLATINNFNVKSKVVGGGRQVPGSRPERPQQPAPSKTTANSDEEYAGAFEGGSFKKNLFMTANLGFGMERYVTPRWSVFIQPTYQHSLNKGGLGPNNVRIHTMSLSLGTRATLK